MAQIVAVPTHPTQQASETFLRRGTLSRRGLMAGLLTGAAASALPRAGRAAPLSPYAHAWGTFKDRFVSGGRVVDSGNGGVSHSEGQGIGLLAAVHAGDRESFDRLHDWTRETLSRPYDALHAWRYRPGAAVPVDDMNNATDGDLLITLALFTAAARWEDPRYHAAAMRLTRDIRTALVRETPRGVVLLPGAAGFTARSAVTLNPSYYVYPALRQMRLAMPDPVWTRLWDDSLAMLRTARFGSWGLPADWVSLPDAGEVRPADKWPARFSFDAVRIPLYMCWGGLAHEPAVAAADAFWTAQGGDAAPAWADLRSGAVAPYRQSAGMTAIRRYVAATRSGGDAATLPTVDAAADYYAAALILLVRIAVDSAPRSA